MDLGEITENYTVWAYASSDEAEDNTNYYVGVGFAGSWDNENWFAIPGGGGPSGGPGPIPQPWEYTAVPVVGTVPIRYLRAIAVNPDTAPAVSLSTFVFSAYYSVAS